jgi:hypothetical protein
MTLFKNILSTVLVSSIFALHPSLNKGNTPITYLQHFVYGNSLTVSTNENIDESLIQIKWVCEAKDVLCEDIVVFENGKQINDIPSEKGSQILLVYYNGKMIGEVPQNKTIKNQAHQYNIELLSKNNSLFFKGEITGPSDYHGSPVTIASL